MESLVPRADMRNRAARLETERLILREFLPEDLDAYAAMCADAEVMRYLSADGRVLTREDAWRQMAMFAGHWVLRGFGMWVVEHRQTGEFLGRVGLHYPEGWPEREVGWCLARPYWGQGFATEAAEAAMRHAFEHLEWQHVVSVIQPENRRSIQLAERLGERFEGTEDVGGVPQHIYGLARGRTMDAGRG
jgi:RimJ/RimL family protein N-acetyltransferase